MLSIGEFAQATGLTVKALRHYDERGVLVPAGSTRAPGTAATAGGSSATPS